MSIVKLNNRGVKDATAIGSVTGLGNMRFIKKLTASSSATLSFVDGSSDVVLDDTYKEYVFTFNNIHPSVNEASLGINFSIDSGSNYNVTKTTTFFQAYHSENGSANALQYSAGADLAQSTGDQRIISGIDDDNDSSGSGYLSVFNPSSTTFVKHFISQSNTVYPDSSNLCVQQRCAGYANTTSAVDAVQFKMSSGDIDAGDICLYGIL